MNTATVRYLKACHQLDLAREEGANEQRLERLQAWVVKLREEAEDAMQTPFTIGSLFADLNTRLS